MLTTTTIKSTYTWPKRKSTYRPSNLILVKPENYNIKTHHTLSSSPSPSPSPSSPSPSPCPSPYPPSTPFLSSSSSYSSSSDDDSESQSFPTTPTAARKTKATATKTHLRTTLAALPELQLRELIVRLVDHSPGFQHALARELLRSPDTPINSNINSNSSHGHRHAKPHQRRRRPRRATITGANTPGYTHHAYTPHNTPTQPPTLRQRSSSYGARHQVYYYHPGRLEEDVFEFPSWSPSSPVALGFEDREEVNLPVLRTIRMWSCCDGDPGSVGCCSSAPGGAGRGEVGGTVQSAGSGGVSDWD